MTLETILLILLIVLILVGAGYLSASETALTAASKAKLHQIAKTGNKKARTIRELQKNVGLTLSALLMGNILLNAFATSTVTDMLTSRIGKEGVIFAPIIMSVIIVIFAEVMPKIIAVHQPERVLLAVATPIRFVFNIFRPVTLAINYIARYSLWLLGFNIKVDTSSHATLEELRGVIDLHHGPGQDVAHERAMLKSILDLGSVQVGEIMIHRKNVTMIDVNDSPTSIVDQVLSSPFSRLPLWKDDPDNIVGIINAKALLRAVRSHQGSLDDLDIVALANQPWFIPESTDLLEQLQAFRERREHFSLVVDEYGALMGIVTLEDILEEIVGEISDEHDITVRGVRPQADGSYIVDGNVTIRDLNRQFEWELPNEEASTLAGLILYDVRQIPSTGQVFMLYGFRFEILRKHRHQITLVRITPPLDSTVL